MKTYFSKYKKFLFNLFAIWFFLVILKVFKVDFGLNLFTFFKILLLLTFFLVTFEVKRRWTGIRPIIKSFFLESKNKITEPLAQYPSTISKVIHFFPLFFRYSWRGFKKYSLFRDILLASCFFGILFDVFLFGLSSNFIILFFTGLWILIVKLYKFEGRISVVIAFLFLMMCPFLLIFKKDLIAEKVAIWVYIFLVIAAVQMTIGYMKEQKKD